MGTLMARLSRRVGAGFHGCGRGVLVAGMGTRWSAGVRESSEPCQGAGDHVGPGPVACESQVPTAGSRDHLGSGGQEAEPETEGLPPAGFSGQGEHGQPGRQVECELDDLQPDLVLCGVVEGPVTQAGGAGGTAAVLSSGPLPVPQFKCGDGDTGGVGGEAGQPQSVGIGDALLGAGAGPLLVADLFQQPAGCRARRPPPRVPAAAASPGGPTCRQRAAPSPTPPGGRAAAASGAGSREA